MLPQLKNYFQDKSDYQIFNQTYTIKQTKTDANLFLQATEIALSPCFWSPHIQIIQSSIIIILYQMEHKKYQIECYVTPWFGHCIPMGKVAQIIQENLLNVNIKVITFEFMKNRIEKQFKNLNVIGIHPDYTIEIQNQIDNLPFKIIFQTVFTYFDDYLNALQQFPDLIIADFTTVAAIRFAKKHKIPLIVNFPNSYETLRNHFNFLNLHRSLNCQGFLIHYPLESNDFIWPYEQMYDAIRNHARCIFHSFVGLDEPGIMPSHHTFVGLTPNRSFCQLTPELREWIDQWKSKGKDKFIYVSFGSHLHLTQKFTKSLATYFIKLGYPIIWSLRSNGCVQLDDPLIFRRPWLPQIAILNLPQIKAYVTHCGWGSITQAIQTKTPLLCFPVFFDQPLNASLVVRNHLGVSIEDKTNFVKVGNYEIDITEGQIVEAVNKVMRDSSYQEAIKRMNKMSRLHKAEEKICLVVRQALEFGNNHLICKKYEQATIKTGQKLSKILAKDYLPPSTP